MPPREALFGPGFGVAPGGAPAELKRIPISGDHMPGVGTAGGATAARIGWGAVRGVPVSLGRRACTGGGCAGGWGGAGAAYGGEACARVGCWGGWRRCGCDRCSEAMAVTFEISLR